MELNRLVRVIRSRWAILALISIVGFTSAFGLTAFSSGDVVPLYEATVPIQFTLEEEETVEDLETKIETERGIAAFAVQDQMAQDPQSFTIFTDPGSARLVFRAWGETEEEARARVRDLVNAYLEEDPSTGGDVSGKLADLELRAEQIQAEIDALQPTLTPEEQALRSQHALLDLTITRIQEAIVALTVANAGATSQEQSDNAERIANLETQFQALQAEKVALPPAPSEELDAVGQFRLDALTRLLDALEVEYQQYAMRSFGVTNTGGTVQSETAVDLTADPPSPFVNGGVGLIGGATIALFALVLTARARKEVWLASDLPVPLLGIVPRRRPHDFQGPTWYDSSEGGDRKGAVQAIRSAVEGALQNPGSSIAMLGDRVGSVELRTLAADLGAAFASAGQSVLLIDADYSQTTDLTEYSVGHLTLETFLRLPAISKSQRERILELLDDAIYIRPGLAVVPSGNPPASPADALAAPQFRSLLEEGRQRFDLVIVVAGAARSPSAGVITQRVGAALLVISPGKTTVPGVDGLMAELDTQGVRTVGAVMLSGLEDSGVAKLPLPAWARTTATLKQETAEAIDPIGRLRFYPFPGDKGSNLYRAGSLRTLLGNLSGANEGSEEASMTPPEDGQLATELLGALAAISEPTGREPVADYLVARVEDYLTPVSGQENLSGELVDLVLKDGYIPLTTVRGHRTVGQWLLDELKHEFGEEDGERLAAEFARTLETEGTDTAGALDWWLTDEFFVRHIERTAGEPEVWHLSSEEGTLHLLVFARRLNRERLDRISRNVVQRCIDELQRRVDVAQREDDLENLERFEAGLRDLYIFEVGLRTLQVGNSEESRIHYPWRRDDQLPKGWAPVWTEGIRPNIAPLQRLGLLAHPVLDEAELVATQSA